MPYRQNDLQQKKKEPPPRRTSTDEEQDDKDREEEQYDQDLEDEQCCQHQAVLHSPPRHQAVLNSPTFLLTGGPGKLRTLSEPQHGTSVSSAYEGWEGDARM